MQGASVLGGCILAATTGPCLGWRRRPASADGQPCPDEACPLPSPQATLKSGRPALWATCAPW